MVKEERIEAFIKLKQELENINPDVKDNLYQLAQIKNPWFTRANIDLAIDGICRLLDSEVLLPWLESYQPINKLKNIGLVMAGNIPLVGFHDFLCVLLAGHNAVIKLSSQDEVLPNYIFNLLKKINPGIEKHLTVVDKLSGLDGVIATGSNNTSRYFIKYFKDIPHIIRKNRVSIAVVDGTETSQDLGLLGNDIFSYFGLGCRNVAKIYIPAEFNIISLLDSLESCNHVIDHNKYFNNYEYNKAIYLINKTEHLDNGFALFTKTSELISPLSVVYYEHYENNQQLLKMIDLNQSKIQCIVGNGEFLKRNIPFGQAQFPYIDDYADGVDTMAFLCDL